jgi:hypothetical protein
VAYSLSAGNAGTGFRYRTHLVVLAIAMLVVLREHVLTMRAARRLTRRGPAEVPVPPLDASLSPV